MRWIDQGLGPVPIQFQKLVNATVSDAPLRKAIDELVATKQAGAELDRGPRIPLISDFIENEMARLEEAESDHPSASPPTKILNGLFRDTLAEVWQNSRL